jgi:hypothetical protein
VALTFTLALERRRILGKTRIFIDLPYRFQGCGALENSRQPVPKMLGAQWQADAPVQKPAWHTEK